MRASRDRRFMKRYERLGNGLKDFNKAIAEAGIALARAIPKIVQAVIEAKYAFEQAGIVIVKAYEAQRNKLQERINELPKDGAIT